MRIMSPDLYLISVGNCRHSTPLLSNSAGEWAHGCGAERLHLADGDLVETFQTVALRKVHVDEFSVHPLDVGEHEQLLHGGVVAHVAVELGICVAPLFRGQTEESHVQQVGFAGVGDGRLRLRDFRWDKMLANSVGMDAVVELGQGAVEVPCERESAVLVFLEALELLDEVELELNGDPGGELEGDVLVCIRTAVASGSRDNPCGPGLLDPLLRRERKAVQACLKSNPVEFDGIKIRVVEPFPDAEEFNGVPVPKPVPDHIISVVRILIFGDVRKADKVLVSPADDANRRTLDIYRVFLGCAHACPSHLAEVSIKML